MAKLSKGFKYVGKLARLRRFVTLSILFLFFIVLIGNAVIISIQERDITPGLRYLGSKFLFATNNLAEDSQTIIDNKGIFDPNKKFFW